MNNNKREYQSPNNSKRIRERLDSQSKRKVDERNNQKQKENKLFDNFQDNNSYKSEDYLSLSFLDAMFIM